MLSLGLMLLLGGIAAYFRAKGWMIALAAFVGALIGGSVWWALFNSFAGNDVLKALARREWVNAKNPEQVARYVVPFVVAGLVAP